MRVKPPTMKYYTVLLKLQPNGIIQMVLLLLLLLNDDYHLCHLQSFFAKKCFLINNKGKQVSLHDELSKYTPAPLWVNWCGHDRDL